MNKSYTQQLLQKEFNSVKSIIKTLPKPLVVAKQLLPEYEYNDKVATAIALFELGLFTSNLNNKIRLNSKTLVTTNIYMFIWMESGSGKDKGVNTINKALSDGYKKLYRNSYNKAVKRAKALATKKGNITLYKKYFIKPKRLGKEDVNSTPEGTIYSMNLLEQQGNAYCISTSELGNELQTSKSSNLQAILKLLVLGYDTGYITAKSLRDDERQLQNVKNLNISSLMFSSIHSLTKISKIRDKFISEMISGLARRSILVYIDKLPEPKEFNSIEEFDRFYEDEHKQKESITSKLGNYSAKLVDILPTDSEITLSKEARKWHNRYLQYCKYLASNDKYYKYPMTRLSLEHRAWLALKLSGILCMLSGNMVISKEHYLQAIGLGLLFIEDVTMFHNEVNKSNYERLIDYCRIYNNKGSLTISKHTLFKEGFLSKNELTEPKMKNLCELSTEADKHGVYTFTKKKGGSIRYIKIKDTAIKVANKPIKTKTTVKVDDTITRDNYMHKMAVKWFRTNDKESKMDKCNKGYENKEYLFKDIGINVLCENTSYNDYWYKDGIKGNNTIEVSSSKLFILDVDKSKLTIEQMHNTLKEYKHHIATTSDKENLYKYRIIFELDREIDLTPKQWRKFYKSIGTMLNIPIDTTISKGGTYLGYKDSILYTTLQGKYLETKAHLIEAYKEEDTITKIVKFKSSKELDKAWENRFELFKYAYEAPMGTGGFYPYIAMHKALEMGFPPDYVKELIIDINYAWELPMSRKDLNNTLIKPILGEEFES